MSLRDVVFVRLKIVLEEFVDDPDYSNARTLEEITGLDDAFLQGEFRGHLNGNRYGFADLLKTKIEDNEVRTSTKVGSLVSSIMDRRNFRDISQYEAKSRERIRLLLRIVVAELSMKDKDDVIPTETLRHYIGNSDDLIRTIESRLNDTLHKYLVFPVQAAADVNPNRTLCQIQEAIVEKTLA